jgi:hypothetical protein
MRWFSGFSIDVSDISDQRLDPSLSNARAVARQDSACRRVLAERAGCWKANP